MYELIRAGENSYYVDCPAKIGIVVLDNNGVCLIDSGSDKDTGKKVRQILEKQNWKLKAIFNTHSHADHVGGNNFFQKIQMIINLFSQLILKLLLKLRLRLIQFVHQHVPLCFTMDMKEEELLLEI